MHETLLVLGYIGLLIAIWNVSVFGIYFIKEVFFSRVDDWFTGIIYSLIGGTIITVSAAIYIIAKHVSIHIQ